MKVLIIDDHPDSSLLLGTILESNGYSVIKASDAVAGLIIAERDSPDLIVMDIQLPGLDGEDALRRLRANNMTKDIKVLAITALAMKGDREQFINDGFDEYMSKPIDCREFIRIVRTMTT